MKCVTIFSSRVYSVVKLYLIFAVTVSFALQIYVPIIMIEPVMLAKVQLIWKHPKFITLFPYILRVSVVAITGIVFNYSVFTCLLIFSAD